eukprot:6980362-Alexandrium_andersonii.AAC.1
MASGTGARTSSGAASATTAPTTACLLSATPRTDVRGLLADSCSRQHGAGSSPLHRGAIGQIECNR